MNRQERRLYEKKLRKSGMSKEVAKQTVKAIYGAQPMSVGQKCKLNYQLIIRHPDFKKQKDVFVNWIKDNENSILTVSEIRSNGMEVTFEEDKNEPKLWHHVETLTPIATATIKLDDGTEKVVNLDGVTTTEDPKIQEEINKAMEE